MYGARLLTSISAVFLNLSGQIFSQPSAVSTELTFLTRFIAFKGVFLQRQTHPHQPGGTVQLESDPSGDRRNAESSSGLG